MPRFAKQHDTERMVDLRVSQENAFDRHVSNGNLRVGGLSPQKTQLLANVWRCIEEEPAPTVYADGGRGLRPRMCV